MFAISHGGNAPAIFQHPITESRLEARQDPSLILFSNWLATITRGIVTTGETQSFALVNFFYCGIPTITGPKMIIPRFTAFLQAPREKTHSSVLSNTRGSLVRAHTNTSVRAFQRYISHRRTSLYVNCIRNSEYPANFLRADHLRISAKRTSIRRSLHHKFRRTCVTPTSQVTSHYRCKRRT